MGNNFNAPHLVMSDKVATTFDTASVLAAKREWLAVSPEISGSAVPQLWAR